ncbi:MAG: hypothetical protein GY742_19105, partial [Hyphomicrobiales bacterium]|nr:hypothetical protein [Hyphomicrobiales bacterium]
LDCTWKSLSGSWLIVIVAAFVLIGSPVTAQAKCAKVKVKRPGEVYLVRGLANIFSLGLDTSAKEYSKMGIENCVVNHKHWRSIADDVVERNRKGQVSFPIVIIGHSLGANVTPQLATLIGKHNIEVSYAVMLDPVEPTSVGKNVKKISNYYIPKSNKNKKLSPKADFNGVLENIDVSKFGGFDHFNIDEDKRLRKAMFTYTLELSNAFAEYNNLDKDRKKR